VVLFVPYFVLHLLIVNFSWIVSASGCRHILPNHLNLGVLWLCCYFLFCTFYFFVDLGFRICHNKLVSEPRSLFCGMTTAKFEIEKFDDQNSFSLWRIKMRALLRQQGLAKVLEPQ
jgi:hypothetical protein